MFDPNNHNLQEGNELEVARDLNEVIETLTDGVDISDTGPVARGLMRIARRLAGKSQADIRRMLAKAAVAQAFDELAESGKL
jgi:hypothetical protein